MTRLKRVLASVLAASIAFTGFAQTAQATLIGTDQVAKAAAQTDAPTEARTGARERLGALLARDDVRTRLEGLGVDPAQADARVAALTDDEAAQLAATLDNAPAGGDILGVIVLIFLVLLVTDILGFTKVYPFTRSIR